MKSKDIRKRILVTGSLGYLGSVLTGYLEQNGFDCVGYDTGFFRDCLLYEPSATKTLIRDARDFEARDMEGVDALVQLAESRTTRSGILSREGL